MNWSTPKTKYLILTKLLPLLSAKEVIHLNPNFLQACDQTQVLTKIVFSFIETLFKQLWKECSSDDEWMEFWQKEYFEALSSSKVHYWKFIHDKITPLIISISPISLFKLIKISMDQNQQESFFSLLKVAAKQKQVFVEKDTIYVKGEETV